MHNNFWHCHGTIVDDQGIKITAGEGDKFGKNDFLGYNPIGRCVFDKDGIYDQSNPLTPKTGTKVVVLTTKSSKTGTVTAFKWCLETDFPANKKQHRCEGCNEVSAKTGSKSHPVLFQLVQVVQPDKGGLVRIPIFEGGDRQQFIAVVDLFSTVRSRVGSRRGRIGALANVGFETAVKNGNPHWRMVDQGLAKELDLPASAICVEMPKPAQELAIA